MARPEAKPFIFNYKDIYGDEPSPQTEDTKFNYLDAFTSDPQSEAYYPAAQLRRLLREEKIAGIKVGNRWLTSKANILFYKNNLEKNS